ncbi:MAG: hypothetical protein GEU98_25285 [Pseudonocardiaceae bacterium]|nr:hypothetical protein [Pseudonocardiaceae bacterium]
MAEQHRHRRLSRKEYAKGLPDYHDPTAGFGGAAPAQSALTLRIVLATAGVVLCAAGAVVFAVAGVVWAAVVLIVLGVVSGVDLGWVIHRKRRGEPG